MTRKQNAMNSKVFHLVIVALLLIIGLLLLKVLTRHYWLMFFLWLLLPLASIWITGDLMWPRVSIKLHSVIKTLLLISAIGLSVINAVNYDDIRHSVGYKLIDGYHIVKSHDCGSGPENADGSSAGEPPDMCSIEDLSKVSWYSKVLLYLMEWAILILAFLIPLFIFGDKNTNPAGNQRKGSEIAKKSTEPLSYSELRHIDETFPENYEEQQGRMLKINIIDSLVEQGYSYKLMKKISIDEASEIGSIYAKWPLLFSEIKDGDELWTYNAVSMASTNSFDHMYGLALVRDQKIIRQLLINAWDDCHIF